MLSETDARELLRQAAVGVPVGEPPADELVRRGRWSRRRTRVSAVVGVAAAVALVAVGSAIVSDDADVSGRPAVAPTTAPTAPAAPEASVQRGLVTPPGTRLVGIGPIAVAVPNEWGTNDVRCGTPLMDTVVFEGTGTRGCRVEQRDVSSVHFGRISDRLPRTWEGNTTRAIDLGDFEIIRSGIGPYDEGQGEPKFDFSVGAVTVPGHDVAMWVVSTDQEIVRQILDSVRSIPDGYVAIPVEKGPSPRTAPFQEFAGLEVTHESVYREGVEPGVLLSTEPPLGSVVPDGSEVTFTVSGPGEPLSGPDGPLVRRLHAFAVEPGAVTVSGVPFGERVAIGLGPDVVRTLTGTRAEEPSAWLIDRPFFAGYTGPFSALDRLRDDPALWSATEGEQLFCPWGRSVDLPGFEQHRRLTIEPSDITSCTQWWAVDVYVDEGGAIDAVSLNLVEP